MSRARAARITVESFNLVSSNQDAKPDPRYAARDRLIAEHYDLAVMHAHKYKAKLPSFQDYDELEAAAVDGLMQAATNYKLEFGASFSTFAGRRIMGAVTDFIRKKAVQSRNSNDISKIIDESLIELQFLTEQSGNQTLSEKLHPLVCKRIKVKNKFPSVDKITEILRIRDKGVSHVLAENYFLIYKEDSLSPEALLLAKERRQHLIDALHYATADATDRAIFVKNVIHGVMAKDLAVEYKCDPSRIAQRLGRVRARINKYLADLEALPLQAATGGPAP